MSKIRRMVRHHPFAVFLFAAAVAIGVVLGLASIVRSKVVGDTDSAGSVSTTSTAFTASTTSLASALVSPSSTLAVSTSDSAVGTSSLPSSSADALAAVLDVRDLDHAAAVLDLTGRCLSSLDAAVRDAFYNTCNDLAIRHLATARRAGCNNWPTLRILFDEFMAAVVDKPGDNAALRIAISERAAAYNTCGGG